MFYCREDELRKLNKRYSKSEFECIVIYGRRRVGKTALINEFCRDKDTIYFSALNAAARENLHTLSKAIEIYKNPDSEVTAEYRSFEDAFAEIGRLSENKRVVFVIDEYPYLAKSEPSVSSRIQHLIDHVWGNGKLYLILCGSSMSFMENQVLGYESPLYGRRTAQFKIEPLTYKDTAVFNPQLTNEENSVVYGITGGVPHYINKLDVCENLDDALLENLFDRSAYLFEEPENLLKQELREPTVYNSIVTAIANGSTKLGEISAKSGIDTARCSKYISTLISLEIVRKKTPITEKPGKKTQYKLADNFFRFWYRFVPENITAVNSGRIGRIYNTAIKEKISEYMGLVFEDICREYLLYYAENLPVGIREVGQWWGNYPEKKKEVQIDIVAETVKKGEYFIGSCKFKNEKIGVDEFRLIWEYANKAFRQGEKYYYIIFSKSGFTQGLKELEEQGKVILVTLDDMY